MVKALAIDIWASTYNPKVGERVTIWGRSDIVEDIDVRVYDRTTGKLLAIYTIYIETLGKNYTEIIMLFTKYNLRFVGRGKRSGWTDEFNMDVIHGPPPTALYLSASNTRPAPGEIVTFTIKTEPITDYVVLLYAYVNGVKKGMWNVAVVGGVGSTRLIPSMIADVTTWQAEADSVRSNTVKIEVAAPPPGKWLGKTKMVLLTNQYCRG